LFSIPEAQLIAQKRGTKRPITDVRAVVPSASAERDEKRRKTVSFPRIDLTPQDDVTANAYSGDNLVDKWLNPQTAKSVISDIHLSALTTTLPEDQKPVCCEVMACGLMLRCTICGDLFHSSCVQDSNVDADSFLCVNCQR